jgi:hypothetical protein
MSQPDTFPRCPLAPEDDSGECDAARHVCACCGAIGCGECMRTVPYKCREHTYVSRCAECRDAGRVPVEPHLSASLRADRIWTLVQDGQTLDDATEAVDNPPEREQRCRARDVGKCGCEECASARADYAFDKARDDKLTGDA